jgi:PAS domain S-box-containing protein
MALDFEKHLRETQQLAQIGSWEWDVASDTLLWSDEHYRIFGLERTSFAPSFQGMLTCLHPEDMPHVQQIVNRSLQDRVPFACEYRVLRPDGTERVLYGRGAWQMSLAGAPSIMYGTTQDITDSKRSDEALLLANESVHELASHILEIQEIGRRLIAREPLDEIGEAPALAHDKTARALTSRQREVLLLIARGHSTKEIARRLNVSVKTVGSHRVQLMERLSINDVAGLVRYAIRTRLIDIGE